MRFFPSCGWGKQKDTSNSSNGLLPMKVILPVVQPGQTWPNCCFGLNEREPRFFWGKQKRPRAVVGSGTQKMPPLASKYVLCVNWRSTMQMLQETMVLGLGHFGCSLALRHYIYIYIYTSLYTNSWFTRPRNAWNFVGKEVWRHFLLAESGRWWQIHHKSDVDGSNF